MAELSNAERRQAYARRVSRYFSKLDRLEEQSVRDSLKVLDRLKVDASRAMKNAKGFDVHQLPRVEAAIDRAVGRFQRDYEKTLKGGLDKAAEAGVDAVRRPLEVATPEISVSLTQIPRSLAGALTTSSVELAQNLSDAARDGILGEVRKTAAGIQTPSEAVEQVEALLRGTRTGEGDERRRTEIAARAERIVRTETNRAYSTANFQAARAVTEVLPDAKKQWITNIDGRERASHLAVNGEVVAMSEPFSNGLQFPLDPAGAPEEVIGCRCRLVISRDDWGKMSEAKA